MIENEQCLEAHEMAFNARDGMSGRLDYGFLGKVMDLMQIESEEQLDIIHKVKQVEAFLRDDTKKAKHGSRS